MSGKQVTKLGSEGERGGVLATASADEAVELILEAIAFSARGTGVEMESDCETLGGVEFPIEVGFKALLTIGAVHDIKDTTRGRELFHKKRDW